MITIDNEVYDEVSDTKETVWEPQQLEMGGVPAEVLFCFGKEQWTTVLARLHYDPSNVHAFLDIEKDGSGACNGTCTRFEKDGHGFRIISCIVICIDGADPREPHQICGTICHEATHATDYIIQAMNDQECASMEFRAYTTQWIAQAGIKWFGEQRT